jgi:mRNA interferase RelE/StbE
MFSIHLSTKAEKELKSLPTVYRKRVEKLFNILTLDPLPSKFYDLKKLEGMRDTFRIRIGKIRIVYTINGGIKM